jgi:hypothetical protein
MNSILNRMAKEQMTGKAGLSTRSRSTTFVITPRGLNRNEAATYVGLGVTKFDQLVRRGSMREPIRIDSRILWDIRALDIAFDTVVV